MLHEHFPYRYSCFQHYFGIKGYCLYGCDKCAFYLQENIKDKLRAIPIDVSVEIQDSKRKRRQSSTSQLQPVLDAKDQITREKVCLQTAQYV